MPGVSFPLNANDETINAQQTCAFTAQHTATAKCSLEARAAPTKESARAQEAFSAAARTGALHRLLGLDQDASCVICSRVQGGLIVIEAAHTNAL